MAIACFRLVTLPPRPPLPRRSVPFLRRFMTVSTVSDAFLPYFRVLFFPDFRVLFFAAFRVLFLAEPFARLVPLFLVLFFARFAAMDSPQQMVNDRARTTHEQRLGAQQVGRIVRRVRREFHRENE